MTIVCGEEPGLSVDDYVAVLGRTTLGIKRPLHNPDRIGRLISGASLLVTARENGHLLGLARCITDWSWIAYCAELAVRDDAQGRGIGLKLIETCRDRLGKEVALTLLSEPVALEFYNHIGMKRLDNAFIWERTDRG